MESLQNFLNKGPIKTSNLPEDMKPREKANTEVKQPPKGIDTLFDQFNQIGPDHYAQRFSPRRNEHGGVNLLED